MRIVNADYLLSFVISPSEYYYVRVNDNVYLECVSKTIWRGLSLCVCLSISVLVFPNVCKQSIPNSIYPINFVFMHPSVCK